MRRLSSLALVAAVGLLPAGAHAADWNAQASACTIDDGSIAANRYLLSAGGITFQATATGTINAFCGINDDLGTAHEIWALYTDSDGLSNNARVVVALRQTNKSTGSVSTIDQFDSNGDGATTLNRAFISINGGSGASIDNDNNFYYIQITMTRTTTAETASIRGAELDF